VRIQVEFQVPQTKGIMANNISDDRYKVDLRGKNQNDHV